MAKVQDRVASTTTATPDRVASVVIKETPFSWVVECEGTGCVRRIDVPKRQYVPVDPIHPEGKVDMITYTAPSARRCLTCGPFPTTA